MYLCGFSFCCEYKCVFLKNFLVLFYKGSMYFRLLNMLKKKINIVLGILELLKVSV